MKKEHVKSNKISKIENNKFYREIKTVNIHPYKTWCDSFINVNKAIECGYLREVIKDKNNNWIEVNN